MENKTICNRFLLLKKIGAGSFGEIYSAEDTTTHQNVAIKLENNSTYDPQLEFESKMYKILTCGENIPNIYYYGKDQNFNVMAIDLLGKSLEDILMENKEPLSIKTVLMLAEQMIQSLEYMHLKNFIHRDIKPDNFIMGVGNNSNKVYIIDFGLSKKYRDPTSLKHIEYTDKKSLTGTARYASINAMKGIEQSRRDDLESLAYVLIYLLKGKLPWQGLPAQTEKQKMKKILDTKKKTTVEQLCQGLPPQFGVFLRMVKRLGFTEDPKYEEYKELFRGALINMGFIYDYKYDWIEPKTKTSSLKFPVQPPNENLAKPGRRFNRTQKMIPEKNMPLRTSKTENRFKNSGAQRYKNYGITPRINKPQVPQRLHYSRTRAIAVMDRAG